MVTFESSRVIQAVNECIRVHCFAIFGPGHKLHRPFATFHLRLFDVRLAHRLSAQLHLPVEARRELGIGEGPSPMPRDATCARKGLKAVALQEGTGEEQRACLDATFSARPSNSLGLGSQGSHGIAAWPL